MKFTEIVFGFCLCVGGEPRQPNCTSISIGAQRNTQNLRIRSLNIFNYLFIFLIEKKNRSFAGCGFCGGGRGAPRRAVAHSLQNSASHGGLLHANLAPAYAARCARTLHLTRHHHPQATATTRTNASIPRNCGPCQCFRGLILLGRGGAVGVGAALPMLQSTPTLAERGAVHDPTNDFTVFGFRIANWAQRLASIHKCSRTCTLAKVHFGELPSI